MKLLKVCLFVLLTVFASQSFALAVDEWEYKTVTGNLKPTAGCKDKKKAEKQASTGHRFEKYTKLLCTQLSYGWSRDKVEHPGELTCEQCEEEYEGEFKGAEKYRCYMKAAVVKCRTVKKGW